jgi:hypothetical protein
MARALLHGSANEGEPSVIRAAFAGLVLFALAAGAEERALPAECPPRAVLDAARSALAAGDRERAVRYMQRAKQILAACEERLPQRDPADGAVEEHALAKADPGSEGSPSGS